MELKINAQKKYERTVDNTGKRLTEAEMQQQNDSSLVGMVEIEIWEGNLAVISFTAAVLNGKTERFLSFPAKKVGSTYIRAFKLGTNLEDQITHHAMRAMRNAEEGKNSHVEIPL